MGRVQEMPIIDMKMELIGQSYDDGIDIYVGVFKVSDGEPQEQSHTLPKSIIYQGFLLY